MLVIVDRKLVRATIDPETLSKILEREIDRSEESRAFIEKNRTRLELAIKAYLFAHGVPLARNLVLTPEDVTSVVS